MFEKAIPRSISDFFQTVGIPLTLNKGTSIFHEGEQAHTIYFIKCGLVQINKETEQAKELTIRVCGSGTVIGEGLIFCDFTQHTTTAKTLKQSELFMLNSQLLENHLVAHPALILDYVKWAQTENSKQLSRLRDLLLHGKKGALYSTLIRLANTYGELQCDASILIKVKLTNIDIANLCGTSRKMINRFLNNLQKQEIECENCPLAICRID